MHRPVRASLALTAFGPVVLLDGPCIANRDSLLNGTDFPENPRVGGAMLNVDAGIAEKNVEAGSLDLKSIGECKRLSITCISEVGWWDTQVILGALQKAGGPQSDQWTSQWTLTNAAGCCSLIEVDGLDGSKTRFLMDTGWNVAYMDERFKAEGVDRLLREGEIDFLYITHEHLDHFWGLEAVLRYNPEIKILIPSSFQPPALSYIRGTDLPAPGPKNSLRHQGELVKLEIGVPTKLLEGAVSVGFDVPILLNIHGEQSLYFNVRDLGLVLVTGCCHQNVVTFAEYALKNFSAEGKLYGLYGGLHLAPFGPLGDEQEQWLEKMGSYAFKKIAANHCTGLPAVQRMRELGFPVVQGTGSNGSQSPWYVGNGDRVVFG